MSITESYLNKVILEETLKILNEQTGGSSSEFHKAELAWEFWEKYLKPLKRGDSRDTGAAGDVDSHLPTGLFRDYDDHDVQRLQKRGTEKKFAVDKATFEHNRRTQRELSDWLGFNPGAHADGLDDGLPYPGIANRARRESGSPRTPRNPILTGIYPKKNPRKYHDRDVSQQEWTIGDASRHPIHQMAKEWEDFSDKHKLRAIKRAHPDAPKKNRKIISRKLDEIAKEMRTFVSGQDQKLKFDVSAWGNFFSNDQGRSFGRGHHTEIGLKIIPSIGADHGSVGPDRAARPSEHADYLNDLSAGEPSSLRIAKSLGGWMDTVIRQEANWYHLLIKQASWQESLTYEQLVHPSMRGNTRSGRWRKGRIWIDGFPKKEIIQTHFKHLRVFTIDHKLATRGRQLGQIARQGIAEAGIHNPTIQEAIRSYIKTYVLRQMPGVTYPAAPDLSPIDVYPERAGPVPVSPPVEIAGPDHGQGYYDRLRAALKPVSAPVEIGTNRTFAQGHYTFPGGEALYFGEDLAKIEIQIATKIADFNKKISKISDNIQKFASGDPTLELPFIGAVSLAKDQPGVGQLSMGPEKPLALPSPESPETLAQAREKLQAAIKDAEAAVKKSEKMRAKIKDPGLRARAAARLNVLKALRARLQGPVGPAGPGPSMRINLLPRPGTTGSSPGGGRPAITGPGPVDYSGPARQAASQGKSVIKLPSAKATKRVRVRLGKGKWVYDDSKKTFKWVKKPTGSGRIMRGARGAVGKLGLAPMVSGVFSCRYGCGKVLENSAFSSRADYDHCVSMCQYRGVDPRVWLRQKYEHEHMRRQGMLPGKMLESRTCTESHINKTILEETRRLIMEQDMNIIVMDDSTGNDEAYLRAAVDALLKVDPSYRSIIYNKNILAGFLFCTNCTTPSGARAGTSRDMDTSWRYGLADIPIVGRLFGNIEESHSSGYAVFEIAKPLAIIKKKVDDIFDYTMGKDKTFSVSSWQNSSATLRTFTTGTILKWYLAKYVAHELTHVKSYSMGEQPRVDTWKQKYRLIDDQNQEEHYKQNPKSLHGKDYHKLRTERQAILAEKRFIEAMKKNPEYIKDKNTIYKYLAAIESEAAPTYKQRRDEESGANLQLLAELGLFDIVERISGRGLHGMSAKGGDIAFGAEEKAAREYEKKVKKHYDKGDCSAWGISRGLCRRPTSWDKKAMSGESTFDDPTRGKGK